MATNANLLKAKEAKNDEFYTQLSDINAELQHYDAKNFENKTVLCNCDDPDWSNFFKYFKDNFKTYHLKKLISTHFNKDGSPSYAVIYDGTNTETVPLKGNGDFASDECVAYLKEADIVVTNPPFSVFRKFVAMLMEYEKKFIIIGNINAIIYKEIFPLIKDNKVWFGYNGSQTYEVPEDYKGKKFEKDGKWWAKVSTRWYTNIELKKRQGFLKLTEKYDPKYYPKYDNYDAINVDKVADIPCDYDGVIGVPITFLDKYNPDQFEILGRSGDIGWATGECDFFTPPYRRKTKSI